MQKMTSLTWKIDELTVEVKNEAYKNKLGAFGADLEAMKSKLDKFQKNLENADLFKKPK